MNATPLTPSLPRLCLRLALLFGLLLLGVTLACTPTDPKPCGGPCPTGFSCDGKVCLKDCEKGTTSCGTACVNLKANPKHCGKCGTQCKDSEICKDGKCALGAVCTGGKQPCGEVCVDHKIDAKHCGACNAACKEGESCQNGACKKALACKSGETPCGAVCAKVQEDPKHCGKCGTACKADELCKVGKCEARCKDPLVSCQESCVDTTKSTEHCGACDNKCPTGQVCDLGVCACPKGLSGCGDACVDTKADVQNCGSCGNVCKTEEACVDGVCLVQCAKGKFPCQGTCIDFQNNTDHCGGCVSKCATGLICQSARCQCPAGGTRCDGACVNTKSNGKHCGGCGKACPLTSVCDNGTCKSTCPTERSGCGNSCVDLKSDANHCGTCFRACPGGSTCCNGACVNINTDSGHCGKCSNACSQGNLCCGGSCVIQATDNNNCGNCGVACVAGRSCDKGVCACVNRCHGKCANLQADTDHCGKCDNTCKFGETCFAGKCEPPCPAGQSKCSSGAGKPRTCHDLLGDAAHCGSCGKACATGEVCHQGACIKTCPGNLQVCNRACFDTQSDARHCGACGQACTNGKTCTQGKCTCSNTKEICDNLKDDDCNGKVDDGCELIKAFGSKSGETGVVIHSDAQGNMFVGGMFEGCLDLPPQRVCVSGWTFFIAKVNPKGLVLWVNQITSSTSRGFLDNFLLGVFVASAPGGGAIVSGGFVSDITLGPTLKLNSGSSRTSDIFVAKIDASGKWKWAVRAGYPPNTQNVQGGHGIRKMSVDRQGNVLIVGSMFVGTNTFGLHPGTIKPSNHARPCADFVAKVSSSGVWQWLKHCYSNSGISSRQDGRLRVGTDAANNIYYFGRFGDRINQHADFGLIKVQSMGHSDLYVTKLSPAGKFLWVRTIASPQDDVLHNLAISPKGDVLITGVGGGAMTFSSTISSPPGPFVAKLDTAGQWQFAKKLALPEGYMRLGNTGEFSICSPSVYNRYSATGQLITSKTYNSGWASRACFIHPSGHIYATGHFEKAFTLFGQSIPHKGGRDILLFRTK